jgi:signal transduction histidine kinase
MYSHLATNLIDKSQYDNAKASLKVIQKSTDEMVDKLGDLVWSVNPKQDSLELLLDRTFQFATQMCAAKNIEFVFNAPNNISKVSIAQEHRHHLYLIIKEAINNAVKYSGATLLQLIVKENNYLLEITINDNGKGCDTATVKRGNGLNNMQKRANELGAAFSIQSKAGEGFFISLKVKITQ